METPVPDSLAVPTIAEATFISAERLTDMPIKMRQSKAGVAREEPRTAAEKNR